MTFSQKRFVDIGQALYIEWIKTTSPLALLKCSEDQRRMVFSAEAKYAFEAAEEFAKVFEHQENN